MLIRPHLWLKKSVTSPLLIDFAGVTLVRGDKVISRNLTLQIARGEHVAILGPNGSGKSTLIKAITREIYPLDRGARMRFQVLGLDDWDIGDLRHHLGIVTLDLLHHLSHEVTLRQVTARELVPSGHFNSVGLPGHIIGRARPKNAKPGAFCVSEISHFAGRPVSAMSSGEPLLPNRPRVGPWPGSAHPRRADQQSRSGCRA